MIKCVININHYLSLCHVFHKQLFRQLFPPNHHGHDDLVLICHNPLSRSRHDAPPTSSLGHHSNPVFIHAFLYDPLHPLHLHHRVINPCHDISTPHRRACCAMDDAFGNYPRQPLPPDLILKWLVKADVYGLAEGGATAGNIPHFDPQLLNSCNYQCHHVVSVAIEDQEGNDVLGCIGDLSSSTQAINLLVHPGIVLAAVLVGCWVVSKFSPCKSGHWAYP